LTKINCQIEGCTAPAKYSIYKTYADGTKVWLKVCILCEGVIGDENMRRTGGCYDGKKKVGDN